MYMQMLAVPSLSSSPHSSTDTDVDSSIGLRRSSLQSTLSTTTLGSSSGWDYLNNSSSDETEPEETSELLNPAAIKHSAAAQLLQRSQSRVLQTAW